MIVYVIWREPSNFDLDGDMPLAAAERVSEGGRAGDLHDSKDGGYIGYVRDGESHLEPLGAPRE